MGSELKIDHLDAGSLAWIQAEAARRGVSREALTREVIRAGIAEMERQGLTARRCVQDGLEALAGTWGHEEAEEFLTAIADFNQVDETLWR